MNRLEWYLYPRVCPILSVSYEDLVYCIESYGREDTFRTLASLIISNYEFPYVRACVPRSVAPPSLGPPKSQCRPSPAAATTLLGGYRCTRLSSEIKIPGITLIMRDVHSRLDWSLDTFMERHRMKCWVAVQGKTRRWADDRNDLRSPYARGTNIDSMTKILDAELVNREKKTSVEIVDHGALRDLLVGHGEAIPPTVELYLQTIDKLNPTSISALSVGYGVGLAAMACVAEQALPCTYNLEGLTEEAGKSLKSFISLSGKPLTEIHEDSLLADLIFIDAFPYGTHDLRSYLGEKSTPRHISYPVHITRILNQLRSLVDVPSRTISRIALVISLRELPALPTIEPLILSILSDKKISSRIDLVGGLMSQKRDYAVYLMILRPQEKTASDTPWEKLLLDNYPELRGGDCVMPEEERDAPKLSSQKSSRVRVEQSQTWDTVCLNVAMPKLLTSTMGVSLQGPRILRGKNTFPSRTRNCVIISETNNLDTGDVVYVFGEAHEPPLIVDEQPITSPKQVVSDPLLSRMIAGIQQGISLSPEE